MSIGWSELPNLSDVIGQESVSAKNQIRDWLLPIYSSTPVIAARQSGEILNFAQVMAENDLVLACEGLQVLGVGRVRGPYDYDGSLKFPHKRPVEWLLLDQWQMPAQEGLRTTVHQIGKYADNLLELEHRVFNRDRTPIIAPQTGADKRHPPIQLPVLDRFAARIDNVLRRKGQVVLYGPPGTGKTYHAVRVAKELAALQVFHKTFDSLAKTEARRSGLPALCMYARFILALVTRTSSRDCDQRAVNGHLTFERRDGIFKRLCDDAPSITIDHTILSLTRSIAVTCPAYLAS